MQFCSRYHIVGVVYIRVSLVPIVVHFESIHILLGTALRRKGPEDFLSNQSFNANAQFFSETSYLVLWLKLSLALLPPERSICSGETAWMRRICRLAGTLAGVCYYGSFPRRG